MCIFKEFGKFVRNGASVFSEASRGQYNRESQEVQSIKNEVFSKKYRSFSDDKRNLAKDRENVSNDIRKSFEELVLNNG